MNKIIFSLLVCMLLICGCDNTTTNNKSEESTSEILNETTSLLNHKDVHYIFETISNNKQNIDNKLIANVINCDKKLFDSETQKFIYLNEYASNNYMYSNDEGKYEYGNYEIDWHDNQRINRWCELDMDSDGNNEVLLELDSSNILVLHNEDDIVYGYAFPFRGMKCIKTDGSFESSGSAANTYIGKLKFIDGDCYYDELCAWDEVDTDNLIYRINKKDSDRKSVKKYLAEQDTKEDAVWVEGNPIEEDR